MKAVTRKAYGSPEVLTVKEIDKPIPKKDEVLVKVYATTVNRTDCGILSGKPFAIQFFTGLGTPRHLVTGTDFAGQVVEIGESVTDFNIGDRVWGLHDEGLQSQAEYMTIKETKAIATIPDFMSYSEAAACGEGAHYAINFLNKININTESSVLVNGATGAIGSAALQLLKSRGITVTAVGNTKNLQLLRDLGANKVINYETDDFTKDSETYDFILDAVGKSRFEYCKKVLNKGGVYVSSELGKGIENLYLPILTTFSKKKVKFPFPSNCRRSILHLTELMRSGKFKGVIDKVYPIEDVASAYTFVMTGQKTGNVILQIIPESA
jgi:NADPH:quinone reductase-like Zn-dependent oxidoreductase